VEHRVEHGASQRLQQQQLAGVGRLGVAGHHLPTSQSLGSSSSSSHSPGSSLSAPTTRASATTSPMRTAGDGATSVLAAVTGKTVKTLDCCGLPSGQLLLQCAALRLHDHGVWGVGIAGCWCHGVPWVTLQKHCTSVCQVPSSVAAQWWEWGEEGSGVRDQHG
jgi:hypothetical protein